MDHKDAKEFVTVVHNPSDRLNNRFVKIRVPHANYKAQTWSKKSSSFVEATVDILEQNHFNISQ